MAKHKMTFTLPEREIGQGDVIFNIYEDDEKFGTIKISKGALEWFPKGHKKPYKLGWKKFEKAIKQFYGHIYI
jgi:hypothetical protein